MKRTYPKWLYYLALMVVVFTWGLDPTINSYFYNYFSASVLSTISTFISAIFFLAISLKKLKLLNKEYFRIVLPIAFLNSLGNLLQRIGLQYTTPANYAFLEHISCVVVPLAMFVFIRKKPTKWQAFACALCLIGCFILSGMGEVSFGIGDLLCGSAGIFFGICVAATGVYAQELDINLYMTLYMFVYFLVSLLMAITLNFIAPGGVPMEKAMFTFDWRLLLAAAAFGLFTVGVCWLLKTEAIRKIDPTVVAVISPFSAIVAGTVSVCFGLDVITWNLIIGSVIIFVAVLLSEIGDVKKRHS